MKTTIQGLEGVGQSRAQRERGGGGSLQVLLMLGFLHNLGILYYHESHGQFLGCDWIRY